MPPSRPWPASFLCAALLALALGCAEAQHPASPQPRALSAAQLLEIAALLEARGDALRSGQYLSLAIERGASQARVVPQLLRLYVRDGQYRLAVERAENYLRGHPRDVRTRFILGSLYLGLGMNERAAQQYQLVLAAAPERADAHFALASLLREQGRDLARADSHFRAYLQLNPRGAHAEEARSALLQELP
jgi:tetratricopeptide (TPR) repeat protein